MFGRTICQQKFEACSMRSPVSPVRSTMKLPTVWQVVAVTLGGDGRQ
jgi:hypothetical protein